MAEGATMTGAIVATFDADVGSGSLTALVPAGLWVGEVPPTITDFPFAALEHAGEPTTWTSERPYWQDGKFKFHCIAHPLADAETLASRVMAVFDDDPDDGPAVSLTVGTVQYFNRTNYWVGVMKDMSTPSGKPVYFATVEYESKTSKFQPKRGER